MRHSSRFAFGSLVFSGLLGLALLLPAGAASATPTVFNVSGTALNRTSGALGSCAAGSPCAFSGTLGIDTASGTMAGIDITFPGFAAFDTLLESYADSSYWVVAAGNGSGILDFDFTQQPTPGSLAGFTSGSIFGGLVVGSTGQPVYSLQSGTISAPTTAVPEPGSLGMMLLGVAMLGGLAFCSKRSLACATCT